MQRKQFIGLSFASLLALLTEKVFGDTIEIPKKKMATTIKNILICDVPHHAGYTESYYFTLQPYWYSYLALISGGVPVGLAAITNPLNGCVLGFTVDENLVDGVTSVSVEGFKDTGESLGIFTLNFTKGVCVSEVEICCADTGAVIRWLSDTGGICQWVFSGVRELELRVGDALTFKNTSGQIQYSQRKDIYIGGRVTSGDITLNSNVYLVDLKNTIQAWSFSVTSALNVQGDIFSDAILIDNDSFKVYKTTDKFFDVSVQYIYATERKIQTQ